MDAFLAREKKSGLHSAAACRALASRLSSLGRLLRARLGAWRAQGRRIASFGAAVGITTMLYEFGIARLLDFIVDDNPVKQNTLSPGHRLPVYSSAALYERKPDYLVLLAWRYADGFMRKNRAFSRQGGRFVLPLPKFRVL